MPTIDGALLSSRRHILSGQLVSAVHNVTRQTHKNTYILCPQKKEALPPPAPYLSATRARNPHGPTPAVIVPPRAAVGDAVDAFSKFRLGSGRPSTVARRTGGAHRRRSRYEKEVQELLLFRPKKERVGGKRKQEVQRGEEGVGGDTGMDRQRVTDWRASRLGRTYNVDGEQVHRGGKTR